MKVFHTPQGIPVKGILQKIAGVQHATHVDEEGAPDYGDTTVWWEEAVDAFEKNPVTRKEERVWVDEDGMEWFESELVLKEIGS